MSRIFAAEHDSVDADGVNLDSKDGEAAGASTASPVVTSMPPAEAVEKAAPRPRLQLSLQGLLGMRVWAVVGDPDEVEDILDHLMDCGKTVFSVSSGGGAHFATTAELDKHPNLPKAEV